MFIDDYLKKWILEILFDFIGLVDFFLIFVCMYDVNLLQVKDSKTRFPTRFFFFFIQTQN